MQYLGLSSLSDIFVANAPEENYPSEAFKFRLNRINKSQNEYNNLFTKLNTIIDQLKDKYSLHDEMRDEVISNGTDPSSGASSSSELAMSSSSCSEGEMFNQQVIMKNSYKRKAQHEACDYIEVDAEISEYPKREGNIVKIGPNGTEISAKAFYDDISWTTAAVATRALLAIIFSPDILATHTLTGKPSPAFYGRERPSKMQLDPLKTADIIHCVRVKCGGLEREVRSAITTKCADTAKKYKRRFLKKIAKNDLIVASQ